MSITPPSTLSTSQPQTQSEPLSSSERTKVKIVPAAVYYERFGDAVDCCAEAITFMDMIKSGHYSEEVKGIVKKLEVLKKELRELQTGSHLKAHGALQVPNSIFSLA